MSNVLVSGGFFRLKFWSCGTQRPGTCDQSPGVGRDAPSHRPRRVVGLHVARPKKDQDRVHKQSV